MVEKYWEAGPGSICISYGGISHNHLGECGNKGLLYVICTGHHKSEYHVCGVIGCNVKERKIYAYITLKCANSG